MAVGDPVTEDSRGFRVYEIPSGEEQREVAVRAFIARRCRKSTSGVATSLATGFLALMLHSLLIGYAMWGGGSTSRRLLLQRAAIADAATGISEDDDAMTVVSIDVDSVARGSSSSLTVSATSSPAPLKSFGVSVPDAQEFAIDAAGSEQSNDEDHSTTRADEDHSYRALMIGRYVDQITARVDRAWIRPRVTHDNRAFVCRVRIEQDQSGRVREVGLVRCGDDPRWQLSLVRAIETASPLPAPPDSSVFTTELTLDFTALPFSAGAEESLYERTTVAGPVTSH